jgi:tRNA threonylcarbamoyladenosine biosynthesis protein TsaB
MTKRESKSVILSLETATESCSVALSQGQELIAEKYINEPKAHATVLAPFIEEILKENSLTIQDLSAVAVSEGPGSYTGLRVGVSVAKGICYASQKPLLAVNTLAAIAQCAIDNIRGGKLGTGSCHFPESGIATIVPMIDARRMEVYTAVFNSDGEQLTTTEAKVLNADSFYKELADGAVLFTGNGAAKFVELLANARSEGKKMTYYNNIYFAEQLPHASGMRIKAHEALVKQEFKDCAYFEPFYLKDFVAGKPKKLL